MEWGKCQKLVVCESCSQLGWRVLVFRLSSERLDLLWGLTASHGSARRISSEINLIIWGESLLFSKYCFEITVTHGFEMQLQALVLAFYSMAFFQLGEIAFLFNLFFSSLLGSKSPYLVSSGNYGDWPLSPYPAYWFNASDFLHRKLRWKKTGSHKQRGKRKGEWDWFPCLVGLCLYYLWCSCLQAVDQSVKILLHYRSALHCRSQRWVYATQRVCMLFSACNQIKVQQPSAWL